MVSVVGLVNDEFAEGVVFFESDFDAPLVGVRVIGIPALFPEAVGHLGVSSHSEDDLVPGRGHPTPRLQNDDGVREVTT